ncbi:MAG TPA: NAD(P)/FAD-dependent oxidoreductase [Flexilinea sp.]|nr:NAD(P)/FAD-dependent oxidoreductase [Flexilinea sp.]
MENNRKNYYDAIVIGGGLAGLTAASFLAKEGRKVLVCEQSDQVGGLFNSFWRSGYLFDGGIKAIENSSVMMPMLAQLGLLEQVHFHPSPIALIIGGNIQVIRQFEDVVSYFRMLQEFFPSEKAGLKKILQDTKTVYDLMDGFLSFPIPFFDLPNTGNEARAEWFRKQGALFTRIPRALSLMRQDFRPYLEKHLNNSNLINILSDLFPDGTSVFFGLGYFRMFTDYYYPEGGIRTIPHLLSESLQNWGGEIRLNTRVENLLFDCGRASGVRLITGEEIRADYMIAAGDLRQALTQLTPETMLPKKFNRKLKDAEVSHSVFNVFLGIDRPVESLGLQGCSHVFYHPDLNGISENDRIHRPDYFRHVPQEISVPCLQQNELAPQGKTGMMISAMTSWNYNGGWEREPAEYESLKEKYTSDLIAGLEKFIPQLNDHIEICFSATPLTIAQRTSNTKGAIMGWSYHKERTFSRGNFLQMKSSVFTPIPGLLTAGHWTYSPGGSPVAVLTGKLAAEAVLHDVNKKAEHKK